jgi:enoyl-CoA hydratase/carnithine racemase
VVPGPDHIDDMFVELVMAIEQNPKAALAMAQLLRSRAYEDVATGLFAESTVYGLLQAGSEFKGWLKEWKAERRPKRPRETEPPVLVDYEGLIATVTLNRPHVRNAFSRGMRDALADALRGAAYGAAALVVLRGNGPSFCAGGDLTEFGTTRDPSDAHVIRTTRSVPYWAWRCADWLRAEVQGAAVGAGIELAAYAARVAATPDAFFLLPEVAMGLVPGSGGTVSIPRRIGPHRTAFFALSGARLDVPTAHRWGLVDEIWDGPPG